MKPDPSQVGTSPESEREAVLLDALRKAIDEGEASGVAPGDVFARIRRRIKLTLEDRRPLISLKSL